MATLETLIQANREPLTRLYGNEGVDYMMSAATMGKRVKFRKDPEAFNSQYFAAEKDVYELNGRQQGDTFYKHQVTVANEVPLYLQEVNFPRGRRVGLTNNNRIAHSVPSRRMELVAGMYQGRPVDNILRFEAARQIVFTHAAALLNSRKSNADLDTRLLQFHDYLEDKLYSGQKGSLYDYWSTSFHDPVTNEVIGIGVKGERAKAPLLTREHFSLVRHLRGAKGTEGFVYTDTRIKDEARATEKLITKSLLESQGVLQPSTIEDEAGILIIPLGPRPMLACLKDRFENVARAYPETLDVIQDNGPDQGRGQSEDVDFLRFKTIMKGLTAPFEVKFQTERAYRNEEFKFNSIDSTTGIPTGPAHEAFRMRRTALTNKLSFPNQIYFVGSDFTLEDLVRLRGAELVEDLKGRNLVIPETVSNNGVHRSLARTPVLTA